MKWSGRGHSFSFLLNLSVSDGSGVEDPEDSVNPNTFMDYWSHFTNIHYKENAALSWAGSS